MVDWLGPSSVTAQSAGVPSNTGVFRVVAGGSQWLPYTGTNSTYVGTHQCNEPAIAESNLESNDPDPTPAHGARPGLPVWLFKSQIVQYIQNTIIYRTHDNDNHGAGHTSRSRHSRQRGESPPVLCQSSAWF